MISRKLLPSLAAGLMLAVAPLAQPATAKSSFDVSIRSSGSSLRYHNFGHGFSHHRFGHHGFRGPQFKYYHGFRHDPFGYRRYYQRPYYYQRHYYRSYPYRYYPYGYYPYGYYPYGRHYFYYQR